jgi:hypothetical protein
MADPLGAVRLRSALVVAKAMPMTGRIQGAGVLERLDERDQVLYRRTRRLLRSFGRQNAATT